MKNVFILFVALVLSSFTVKSQTFSSGHLHVTVTDSVIHDSTVCGTRDFISFHVVADTSFVGDTIRIIDSATSFLMATVINTAGASPWVFNAGAYSPIYVGGTMTIFHDYLLTGPFYVGPHKIYKFRSSLDTVVAHRYPSPCLVTDPCEYSTVSGNTFIDNNSNCVFDAGDDTMRIPFYDMMINETFISPGGGYPAAYSGFFSGPSFSLNVQKSWVATCSLSIPSYYYFIFATSSCPAGPYGFTSLPATGADFPFKCTSNVDVVADALLPCMVRAHTPFYLRPYASNTGCDTVSGQLVLVKDSHTIYDASLSAIPADYASGDTLTWDYAGISNIAGGPYWNRFLSAIHLTPDTTITGGDTLCFTVYTGTPSADIDPTNNMHSFCVPVVYSYDPNVKEVSPRGAEPEGYIAPSEDTLTYTLHFQNTGTAAAHTVRVRDTLDSNINPASLRILGTSHNMSPQWIAPNVVEFTFNNINLPDSAHNEPASHGAVRFSVALNAGLAPGTQIKNKGYIYFDLNPPVITNTVLNTIELPIPTNVNEGARADVKVYPNPATNDVTLENAPGGEVTVTSMSGAILIRKMTNTGSTTIDVSKLPAGVYMVRTATSVSRFVKLSSE